MMDLRIVDIRSKEILSAGSFPTLETTVILGCGISGTASVPFGSSPGMHEAVTLVDGDSKRYRGLGMLTAIHNVENRIAPELKGKLVVYQESIDRIMLELDGTDNKSNLGGNSILSVSLACARAASKAIDLQMFQYLRHLLGEADTDYRMPKPMMVAIEGGKHADQSTDFQEYMIIPRSEISTRELVRQGIEIYQTLRDVLKEKGYSVNVGYEGAYAPTNWKSNKEPLDLIAEAIERAGYKPLKEVGIGLDPAASEFYLVEERLYDLSREGRKITSKEMISYYTKLASSFPIVSIEDGLAEDDWDAWVELNAKLGNRCLIVGDDLTVTQDSRLKKAVELNAINAILIKPNQVGTLTELLKTIRTANEENVAQVVSHRGGGETEDTFIVDLAVALNADMLKVGTSRGERVVKYNRLMDIGTALGL